ncbi:hypothetical protein [Bradyrhizobium sp. CCGB01]|uniref:hypothetical protein n=1 Tax=Bradyrhizobium sp. CCGB01 TaxID=2949634 RepID=UPI0020B35D19|nr:hypothetical protein [Bradyrhizobium sp. CCGB01]MCP3407750.1 hypothetical protein [Bradyrhizobium sp. CCGB01]
MNEPDKSKGFAPDYARPSLHKRLNGGRRRFVKSATIRMLGLSPMHTSGRRRPENAAFLGWRARKHLRKILPFDQSVPSFGWKVVILDGAAFDRAGVFDLLTGPNHLYISTNEPAAWMPPPDA